MVLLVQPDRRAKTPEERLRQAFGQSGYTIFTLRKWFGNGFLAIRDLSNQQSAIIVRQLPHDLFELRRLEEPVASERKTLEKLCRWARAKACFHPDAYNPNPQGRSCLWHEMVPVGQLRSAAIATRGTLMPTAR